MSVPAAVPGHGTGAANTVFCLASAQGMWQGALFPTTFLLPSKITFVTVLPVIQVGDFFVQSGT